MTRRIAILGVLVLAAAAAIYYFINGRSKALVLTGIVTTNDVIVSPQVQGQVSRLLVTEGDLVKKDQLLAVIAPDELRADSAYYAHSAEGLASQVEEGEAALRFQQRQTADQIRQAEAALASAEAKLTVAEADAENARLVFERNERLWHEGIIASDQYDLARTAYQASRGRLDSATKDVEAQRAALELARSNAEQVSVRRHQLQSSEHQQAAADAQKAKADVRLAYTELRSPIDAIVDARAVRQGEVVNPGQPILTLINPDDLWVRADVEETYIDRIRVGDGLTVRLPSGEQRQGTIYYRGVDASFATQRDVSRTKRDIKTFEIRLRVDNADRRLAVGMTAYVLLPVR